jgi:ribonuclease D
MVAPARCQGITTAGAPCRGRPTRFGYCPVHAPSLAPVAEEARKRGGRNRATSRRLRRLLEDSGLGQVFEATMAVLARLERGELTPQEAVAASHLLKVALETVEAAHELAPKGGGLAPQPPPPAPWDEEREARVMARAQQIYEELKASGGQVPALTEEDKRARTIAGATKILQEVVQPQLERWRAASASPPSAPASEAQEEPHAPALGARAVMHGRSPYGEETM